jgi:hypothetical protein
VMSKKKLTPRDIRWLWPDRLAVGKLTVLVGAEEMRKSLLAADICAHINEGKEWPGSSDKLKLRGSVIFAQLEDDLADTTLPRLLAAGTRVTTQPVTTKGPPYFTIVPNLTATTFYKTMEALERDYLKKTKDLRLLVIDPFNAFPQGQAAHGMAGPLERLKQIAEEYRIAVLLVHHFNKNLRRTVREMVYGSSMVRTKSRLMLVAQQDPDNADLSILTGSKNNSGKAPAEGLVYGIAFRDVRVGARARPFPVIEWHGPDDRTADEIAAELVERTKTAAKASKRRRAETVEKWVTFLDKHIKPGGDKVRVIEIEEKAREAGLLRERSQLKDCRPAEHAVEQLGIEKVPEGDGDGGRAVSFWCRPMPPAEDGGGDAAARAH